MKTMMTLFAEVDEHITNVDKKLTLAITKSKEVRSIAAMACANRIVEQGQSLGAVSIILYTFVASILVMFFMRLLARYV